MKKSIFIILTFFMLFALAGCGGGGSSSTSPTTGEENTPDGAPAKPVAAEMTNNYIIVHEDKIHFTLPIGIVKRLDSSYSLELKNLKLDVMGCTIKGDPVFDPAILSMSGDFNSISTIIVTGEFTKPCDISTYNVSTVKRDSRSNNILSGYTLSGIQVVSKGGKVEMTDFKSTFDYANPNGGNTPPSGTGYSFYNASSITVSQVNTSYPLKIQLLKDGYSVSGKEVNLKALLSQYGTVSSPNATTDASGFADFGYISPSVLPANGTSTSLEATFKDENNATVRGVR